jgi:hypothetical protein
MGKLLVQFGNADNWQQIFDETWKAQISAVTGKYDPIGKKTLPILCDHRILAVGTTSLSAKPNWRTGGWITAKLKLPGSTFFNPEVQTFKVPLYSLALWVLPDYGHSYELEFWPAKWLRDVELEIQQYIGEEKDSTEEVIKTLPPGEWVVF